MTHEDVTEQLRRVIAQYERNSTRTGWLLRQLWGKLGHFPRDLSRRLRRSIQKRRLQSTAATSVSDKLLKILPEAVLPGSALPFHLPDAARKAVEAMRAADPEVAATIARMDGFLGSPEMVARIAEAAQFDPEIGAFSGHESAYCVPWNDVAFTGFRKLVELIPPGDYDAVVLMPAGRMGGADLVAAVLARALAEGEKVLILRTDDSSWDRPDWYPETIPSVDISGALAGVSDRQRALYILLTEIAPKRIFNVNSRIAFETFVTYGARLASQFRLYAYYFCSDRTEEGLEVGYPVWFFANILPHLSAAMIDTEDLARTLIARYAIPPELAQRVVTLYTPAQTPVAPEPVSAARLAEARPAGARPRILWGGRLDRQKRFDLVVAIARAMPDVDFLCWGKAVLDAPPDLARLPANLVLNPPFKGYDELPLAAAEGWLYTSDWDGLPTILIELGALGVPIVASGVGGVPELIDARTGWLVPEGAPVAAYVAALREMIDNPQERVTRTRALQALVTERHSATHYAQSLARI